MSKELGKKRKTFPGKKLPKKSQKRDSESKISLEDIIVSIEDVDMEKNFLSTDSDPIEKDSHSNGEYEDSEESNAPSFTDEDYEFIGYDQRINLQTLYKCHLADRYVIC